MAGKTGMQPTKPRAVPEQFTPGFLMATDRRYKPAIIVAQQLAELHETLGGTEALTPQKRALCERTVWLNFRCQQLEQEYLAGAGLDAVEYTALVSTLVRVINVLGIGRRVKRAETLAGYSQRIAGGEA